MSVVSNNILAGASGQGGAGYAIERSIRFNSGDNANLSRTPSSAGNLKTWTLAFWIKRTSFPTGGTQDGYIFNSSDTGNNNHSMMRFQGQGVQNLQIYLYEFSSSYGAWEVTTSRKYRDPSAWYHIVIAMDTTQATAADRLKIYTNGVRETEFDSSNYPAQNANAGQWNSGFPQSIGKPTYGGGTLNAYLADVHMVDGQALAPTDFGETNTDNLWVPKAFAGTYGTNGFHLDFADNSSNAALGTDTSGNSNTWTVNNLIAVGESVSTSAITNVAAGAAVTITSSGMTNAANWFNGTGGTARSQEDSYSGARIGTATISRTGWLSGSVIKMTAGHSGNGGSFSFKIVVTYWDDTTTEQTATNRSTGDEISMNITSSKYIKSIKFELSPGVNGQYANVSALKIDDVFPNTATATYPVLTTTNNNNYSSLVVGDSNAAGVSITAIDSSTPSITVDGGSWSNGDVFTTATNANGDNLRDTPTNGDTASDTGLGGQITGNYATWSPLEKHADITLSNGNLEVATSSNWKSVLSTFGMSSGKWYWEFTPNDDSQVGVCGNNTARLGSYLESDPTAWVLQTSNGTVYTSSSGSVSTGVTWAAGDVVNVAYDRDTTSLWFGKNGTWVLSGNPAAGTGAVVTNAGPGSTGRTMMPGLAVKTGSGYVVNFGSRPFAYAAPTNFKSLNTANLSSTIADGSLYFDTKLYTGDGNNGRNITGFSFSPDFVWVKGRNAAAGHALQDIVRGPGNTVLASHTTGAEGSETYGQISSFDSDGFTVTSGSSGDENINYLNRTFAAWAWDAGSSNTTIAVGGLNSSVYDQSQTWSGMLTAETQGNVSNPTYAFDGTPGNQPSTSARTNPTSTQGGIIFTPTNGYTVTNTIEVYGGSNTDQCFINFGSGYGSAISLTSGAWKTVYTGSGTITNLKVRDPNGGNATGLGGIRIDGKLLVDSGVSVTNVPTIASTVRANPSSGFSIVSYTGAGAVGTIGHGLNAAPGMMIVKSRGTENWHVYHKGLDATAPQDYYVRLNSTGARSNYDGFWNDTAPTSSVFTVGSDGGTSGASDFIAYCFAPVEGYSAMGSYTGNGSADGPFVYTGFKVAFLLRKQTNSAQHWHIVDAERDPENVADSWLFPNLPDIEGTGDASRDTDLLSNGFKMRSTYTYHNQSGSTYIYLAFASNPFASNGGLAR